VINPGEPVPKLSQIPLLVEFEEWHHDRYREIVRVEPEVFQGILLLIQDHHIFHNNSPNPQMPVKIQLVIFLKRAGHYGNAASPEAIAQWAGVSTGTVENCTYRCMIAIVSLHDDAIHLPTAAEKEAAKQWVEEETKCPPWQNGFLNADGTKFPLFQKPGLHGDSWFDKNKEYSLDCQVSYFACQ